MNHARHILSLLLLAAFWLPAQSFPADSVYQVQHQEKVYLHFDNAGYFLRETMWFKAYVLDESNRPTDISRVLYVELVSPEGGVVKTHKCKIEDGMAHGDFYLDSAYLSGFFEVRAYTRHMRNFGEDNYFSRVFPIFEEAVGGDYSVRTMYDRLRPEGLGKDNNPTLRERVLQARKARNDTLPWPVQKAANAVIRYNRRFNPEPIRCDSIPEDLRPGEKVTLTFRTTPRSTFSLSVCEEESHIRTSYRGDICRTMFRDSGWVARSYRAQRDFDPKTDIRYAPEKGIVVDGDLSRTNRRGKKTFLEGRAVSLSLQDGERHYGGNVRTDTAGRWSFTIDDFQGTLAGRLHTVNTDYIVSDTKLRMHKWFSPAPRPFTPEECAVVKSPAPKGKKDNPGTEMEDSTSFDRQLSTLTVEAARRKHYWKEIKRSIVHYSFAEEVEYYADHGHVGIDGEILSLSFLGSLFGRYFYACAPVRWMVVEHYGGDATVPEGEIFDGLHLIPDHIKEIVVRSDYATCTHYNYSNIGFRKNATYHKGAAYGRFGKAFIGIETPQSVHPHDEDIDNPGGGAHLGYMVCFIKYTPEEIKAMGDSSKFEITPTSRVTVVRGFTRLSGFPAPDYSASREGLENDFRRTLYWNPNVRTDENGIARITFYNNARCRNLHISAEGIGGDGNPVVYQQTN